MNCIGIEHYFGNLKKDSIDPAVVSKAVKSLLEGDADISGFIEPDIPKYMIALITGVFDNLALFTAEHYHIKLDKVSVSLSRDSGPLFWLVLLFLLSFVVNPFLPMHCKIQRQPHTNRSRISLVVQVFYGIILLLSSSHNSYK
jgi:hypothetical protein